MPANYHLHTVHRSPTGNAAGYREMLKTQAKAGFVPAMSVDSYGPIAEALTEADAVKAAHFAVWRPHTIGGTGYNFDVPGQNYTQTPEAAAAGWLNGLNKILPPEFDRRSWLAVFNEPDKNRLPYICQTALEIAAEFLGRGWRGVFLNLNAGEPEPEQWAAPEVLALLRLVERYPESLAIGLHEYSYSKSITNAAPWLVGRFAALDKLCADNGINFKRVPIAITEHGYGRDLGTWPGLTQAVKDLDYTSAIYGAFPNVRLVAHWVIADGWGGLSNEVAKLIPHFGRLATEKAPAPVYEPPPLEKPPATYKAIVLKAPQEVTADQWTQISGYAFAFRHTMTASHDDTVRVLTGGNKDSYAKIVFPERPSQRETIAALQAAGRTWVDVTGAIFPSPLKGLQLGKLLDRPYAYTSKFNAPRSYGLHEGIDADVLEVTTDSKASVLAAFPGTVEFSGATSSGYGTYVRIVHERNGGKFITYYAHLDRAFLTTGTKVVTGQPVGEIGNTGNSTAEHIHFTLRVPDFGLSGYVVPDVVDPEPYLPDPASLAWPSPTRHDLGPFLFPAAAKQYIMRHPSGSQERYITRPYKNGYVIQKNRGGEYYEIDNNYIYLVWDTTPDQNRYYVRSTAKGSGVRAAYLPRRMYTGESWRDSGHWVQFYNKSDCKESSANSGSAAQTAQLLAVYESFTTPEGAAVGRTIKLRAGQETHYFAQGWGRVGWESAWGSAWKTAEDISSQPLEPLVLPGCMA